MNIIPNEHILSKLACVAKEAGKIIMTYYGAGTGVTEKADGSPVTMADQEAEKYIINALKKIEPDIICIGEESVSENLKPSRLKRYWCIDPIDGTREFISDRPEFTVNIALIEEGVPVLGVIYAPALDMLYMGSMDEGSFRVDSLGTWAKLPVTDIDRPFTVVISRLHPTKGMEESFLNEIRNGREVDVKILGSSLKFCMVADGSADIYFRDGRTMFWDSAAGHIIAKAAKAEVVEWKTGKELRYDNDTLENPSFIVHNPKRTKGIVGSKIIL